MRCCSSQIACEGGGEQLEGNYYPVEVRCTEVTEEVPTYKTLIEWSFDQFTRQIRCRQKMFGRFETLFDDPIKNYGCFSKLTYYSHTYLLYQTDRS